jgi:hypothetical protein
MQRTAQHTETTESTTTTIADGSADSTRADRAMATVLADIFADASSEPMQYLRDVIVPEGGE